MARETLTGSRIRERRMISGLRQAELARSVGISASYLNLIEHNRRRIGGKLLVDIAAALAVEPSTLTEGAEAALLSTLREAAAEGSMPQGEVERAEELAGRFPIWAELLANYHKRVDTLERTVQTLSDRLTHDPQLAASLHEVLSTAAAIRSTASILVETEALETEWQDRFHRNINQDAERLADSSRALVKFLDDGSDDQVRRAIPQEEAEAFFQEHDFHFPIIEQWAENEDADDLDAAIKPVLDASKTLGSVASRTIAETVLRQIAEDARALPFDAISSLIADCGFDPFRLQQATGADLAQVMRRLAALPPNILPSEAGLIIIDGSGALLFRKPVAGFAPPGLGAACPLWPVYSALHRPMHPVQRRVRHLGRSSATFDCFAYAWPHKQQGLDGEPLFRSAMLVVPVEEEGEVDSSLTVGNNCRVCPRQGCDARREPSILTEEF